MLIKYSYFQPDRVISTIEKMHQDYWHYENYYLRQLHPTCKFTWKLLFSLSQTWMLAEDYRSYFSDIQELSGSEPIFVLGQIITVIFCWILNMDDFTFYHPDLFTTNANSTQLKKKRVSYFPHAYSLAGGKDHTQSQCLLRQFACICPLFIVSGHLSFRIISIPAAAQNTLLH